MDLKQQQARQGQQGEVRPEKFEEYAKQSEPENVDDKTLKEEIGDMKKLLESTGEEHDKLKLKKDDVKIKKVVRQPNIQILLAPNAPYGPRRPKQT